MYVFGPRGTSPPPTLLNGPRLRYLLIPVHGGTCLPMPSCLRKKFVTRGSSPSGLCPSIAASTEWFHALASMGLPELGGLAKWTFGLRSETIPIYARALASCSAE